MSASQLLIHIYNLVTSPLDNFFLFYALFDIKFAFLIVLSLSFIITIFDGEDDKIFNAVKGIFLQCIHFIQLTIRFIHTRSKLSNPERYYKVGKITLLFILIGFVQAEITQYSYPDFSYDWKSDNAAFKTTLDDFMLSDNFPALSLTGYNYIRSTYLDDLNYYTFSSQLESTYLAGNIITSDYTIIKNFYDNKLLTNQISPITDLSSRIKSTMEKQGYILDNYFGFPCHTRVVSVGSARTCSTSGVCDMTYLSNLLVSTDGVPTCLYSEIGNVTSNRNLVTTITLEQVTAGITCSEEYKIGDYRLTKGGIICSCGPSNCDNIPGTLGISEPMIKKCFSTEWRPGCQSTGTIGFGSAIEGDPKTFYGCLVQDVGYICNFNVKVGNDTVIKQQWDCKSPVTSITSTPRLSVTMYEPSFIGSYRYIKNSLLAADYDNLSNVKLFQPGFYATDTTCQSSLFGHHRRLADGSWTDCRQLYADKAKVSMQTCGVPNVVGTVDFNLVKSSTQFFNARSIVETTGLDFKPVSANDDAISANFEFSYESPYTETSFKNRFPCVDINTLTYKNQTDPTMSTPIRVQVCGATVYMFTGFGYYVELTGNYSLLLAPDDNLIPYLYPGIVLGVVNQHVVNAAMYEAYAFISYDKLNNCFNVYHYDISNHSNDYQIFNCTPYINVWDTNLAAPIRIDAQNRFTPSTAEIFPKYVAKASNTGYIKAIVSGEFQYSFLNSNGCPKIWDAKTVVSITGQPVVEIDFENTCDTANFVFTFVCDDFTPISPLEKVFQKKREKFQHFYTRTSRETNCTVRAFSGTQSSEISFSTKKYVPIIPDGGFRWNAPLTWLDFNNLFFSNSFWWNIIIFAIIVSFVLLLLSFIINGTILYFKKCIDKQKMFVPYGSLIIPIGLSISATFYYLNIITWAYYIIYYFFKLSFALYEVQKIKAPEKRTQKNENNIISTPKSVFTTLLDKKNK